MLSCRRTMLPTLVHLRFESPPGQRESAIPAEVADVIEIAPHQAVRAVWCNYRVHAVRLQGQVRQIESFPQEGH